MLLYGHTNTAALRVLKRKVLHKIFGPARVGDDFRILYNSELYEFFNKMGVAQRINIQRLHWLGHVVRMEEAVPARLVFEEVGEEDDLVSVGRAKSRMACHRLV